MKTAFYCIDVICKRKYFFLECIIVLYGNLYLNIGFLPLNKNRLVNSCVSFIDVFHKGNNTALVHEFIFFVRSFILENNSDALVQKGQLSNASC